MNTTHKVDTLLWACAFGPLGIASVRMQYIEFKHRKSFMKTAWHMLRKDKHRIFYRGVLPIISCQFIIALILQNTLDNRQDLIEWYAGNDFKIKEQLMNNWAMQ